VTQRLYRWLDAFLEFAFFLGYTNIGYHLRRFGWDPADLDVDLSGRHAVVTGANSGLGYAISEELAALGATLTLVVRDRDRGEEARAAIADRTANPAVHLEIADVSGLASVRGLADRLTRAYQRLDILIHNAGVLLDERRESIDKIELTFATHVLGPFLLTGLLTPLLEAGRTGRVIWVSSAGMYTQRLDVDDLQSERGDFNGTVAYARAKRAQVILAELWAEQLASSGVAVSAMHPGWVDTPGLERSLPTFYRALWFSLRAPPQGADTAVWLAAAPHPTDKSGLFWFDRRPRPKHKLRRTQSPAEDRRQLWDECLRLSGLSLPDRT
jgi:NAD(P)-dependent dehydrogenase (short-subunit alcohol dehydrogenase family)